MSTESVSTPSPASATTRGGRDDGFDDARALIARWLLTAGVPADRAWDVARELESILAAHGGDLASPVELRGLGHRLLREHVGGRTAERLRCWHEFEELDRPLVVMIGGAAGVGKSTVATQLAYRLGITRVSSTDLIRQVLRSVVPAAIAPELSRSSFELDGGRSRIRRGRPVEFERQARQVMVGVNATIERAVAEGSPVIVEGIHLLPELVDPGAVPQGLLVHVVLSVECQHEHGTRFRVRARCSERPADRYLAGLARIRELQDHVVASAHRVGTPVLANRRVDATVRDVLDEVFTAVEGVLAGGEPEPVRQ